MTAMGKYRDESIPFFLDKYSSLEMTLPEKQKYLHKTFLKFRTNLGPITGEESVSKK